MNVWKQYTFNCIFAPQTNILYKNLFINKKYTTHYGKELLFRLNRTKCKIKLGQTGNDRLPGRTLIL